MVPKYDKGHLVRSRDNFGRLGTVKLAEINRTGRFEQLVEWGDPGGEHWEDESSLIDHEAATVSVVPAEDFGFGFHTAFEAKRFAQEAMLILNRLFDYYGDPMGFCGSTSQLYIHIQADGFDPGPGTEVGKHLVEQIDDATYNQLLPGPATVVAKGGPR